MKRNNRSKIVVVKWFLRETQKAKLENLIKENNKDTF